jgi:O-antigen ligase
MSPTRLVVALATVLLLAVAAMRWRRLLVMSLPFLAILNGFTFGVGGSSVRLDQLAACALAIPLVASILIGARRLQTDATAWWLAGILAMNVVASALNSPARSYSVAQCASLASVWVIYVLLLNFLDTPAELDAFLRRMIWACILASGIAIGAFLLAVVGIPVGGAEVSASAAERLTMAYGAYGTMLEPNILGSFSAAHLVLVIALLAVAAQRPGVAFPTNSLRWAAALCAVALILSFTRAAWLGAIVGVLFIAGSGARTLGVGVRPSRVVVPVAVGSAVMGMLLLLPGDAGQFMRFKLVNFVNLGSQTGLLRLATYGLALQQSLAHPFIGWGTYSFAPLVAQGNDFRQFENWRNLWVGNYLLLALHDTGVIGLFLWCGMLWSILSRGVRAARRLSSIDAVPASRTLALTAAVVSLLVTFLSTSGFSLGYPWELIGLLGAYCYRGPAVQPVAAPPPILATTLEPLPADAT